MFYYVFHYNIIKVNHILYGFIKLLHLICSLALTRAFLVPYVYVYIESIDYILLSSFELKRNLTNFFSKIIMPFTFKSLLYA